MTEIRNKGYASMVKKKIPSRGRQKERNWKGSREKSKKKETLLQISKKANVVLSQSLRENDLY